MEEKNAPEGWERVDRSKITFADDGRIKILGHCEKCKGTIWFKQTKWFKRFFIGHCPACNKVAIAKARVVQVTQEAWEENDTRIRDVDLLAAHLTDIAVRTMDPVVYDAAEMLKELNEKHWSECWQIGVYSDAFESGKEDADE